MHPGWTEQHSFRRESLAMPNTGKPADQETSTRHHQRLHHRRPKPNSQRHTEQSTRKTISDRTASASSSGYSATITAPDAAAPDGEGTISTTDDGWYGST